MTERKHLYAVYAVPRDQLSIFVNGNIEWGGIHITLAGFSNTHCSLKSNLKEISNMSTKDWQLNKNKVSKNKNKIFIESRTLDKIADIMYGKGFNKIKGMKYANYKWHITFSNKMPEKILETLTNLKWNLVIVKQNGLKYEWQERYQLKTL